MDPKKTLADYSVPEKACIYIAVAGAALPNSIKETLGGGTSDASAPPVPAAAAAAAPPESSSNEAAAAAAAAAAAPPESSSNEAAAAAAAAAAAPPESSSNEAAAAAAAAAAAPPESSSNEAAAAAAAAAAAPPESSSNEAAAAAAAAAAAPPESSSNEAADAAAAAAAAKKKQDDDEAAAAAALKKKQDEEAAAAAAASAAALKKKQEEEAAAAKQKADAEAAAAAAAAAKKKKIADEKAAADAAAAADQAEKDSAAAKKQQEAELQAQAKKEADEAYEAAKKKMDEDTFRRKLDDAEAARRRAEEEEAERRRVAAAAEEERRKKERAAKEQREQELLKAKQPPPAAKPVPRASYTVRALNVEMLLMREELERYKLMFNATTQLHATLTATNLMTRAWHVSERTPMVESMRLYSKTLQQRIAMLQSAATQRHAEGVQNSEVDESAQREMLGFFREMYEDACNQILELRSVAGKSSNDAHMHFVRRTNAEQAEFVAQEQLRMEQHQNKYTSERLEEAEGRLKDVETRNQQLIATVEHLGNNLLRRNLSSSSSSSSPSGSPSRSVGVLLSDSSTGQTAPGSTSVMHCIDDVPDHVMSTAVQLERRWAEKDEKIRELTAALTSITYKHKEAVERQKESDSQRDNAIRNNTEMQASLKHALALAKTWEQRQHDTERKLKQAEAEIGRLRETQTKLQHDVRTSEAKADASEAALVGVQLEKDRSAEHVERLKGEVLMVRREVEQKHALIVNLEMRETTLRNNIEPTERRVKELTRSLEQATLLTQKLQKELDKRDQSLQKLRGHLQSVGMLPAQTAAKFAQMSEADKELYGTPDNSAAASADDGKPKTPLQYLQQQQQLRRDRRLLEEGRAELQTGSTSAGDEQQQQQAVYHNKPLGYLGRPESTSPTPSRGRARSPAVGSSNRAHQQQQHNTKTPPRVSSLDITGSINRTRSDPSRSPFRSTTSPASSSSFGAGGRGGPTPNRASTTRQHFTSKFQDIMELADAHVQNITSAHSAIGNRAITAAAGAQIAAVLERLQRALTDTEIELQKESMKRRALEDQLQNARRGVEEMTQINLQIREQSQNAVDDAINFFAGAGGDAMRSVVQEVFAYKEISLENETLKMRYAEQSKRVTRLEVRCQVLERHLEALARGGRAGIDAVTLRRAAAAGAGSPGSPTSSAKLGTADEHNIIEEELQQKAAQLAKEQRKRERLEKGLSAADDAEDSDFDENQFEEDPALLQLIRSARRGRRAVARGESEDTNDESTSASAAAHINSLDAVLRVSPRASTPSAASGGSKRLRGQSMLEQTRQSNNIGRQEMAKLRAAAVKEQNAELERKIAKLDEWRAAILDTERVGLERGATPTGAGRHQALQAADRMAHTPPRQLRSQGGGGGSVPRSGSGTPVRPRGVSPGQSIPKARRDFNYGSNQN